MKIEAKIVTFRADETDDGSVLAQFLQDGWIISTSVKGGEGQVILVLTRYTYDEESAESGESPKVLPIKWKEEDSCFSGDWNEGDFYNYEIGGYFQEELGLRAHFETQGSSHKIGVYEKLEEAKEACQAHKEARWKELVLEFTGVEVK